MNNKQLTAWITVRFYPADLERIRKKAKQMGIAPTTLIRMWVIEKLKALADDPVQAGSEQD